MHDFLKKCKYKKFVLENQSIFFASNSISYFYK